PAEPGGCLAIRRRPRRPAASGRNRQWAALAPGGGLRRAHRGTDAARGATAAVPAQGPPALHGGLLLRTDRPRGDVRTPVGREGAERAGGGERHVGRRGRAAPLLGCAALPTAPGRRGDQDLVPVLPRAGENPGRLRGGGLAAVHR